MSFPLQTPWFGPYRLSSRVATGGMAEVYAARKVSEDGSAGPLVALKRLLPHLARDPNVVRMFLNEARITAQIDHPNVVRVLDLGHEANHPFIAMELLVGHSFADLREKAAERAERVPLGITLKVLCDACRGLNAAHNARDEQGRFLWIVHRDFTPDNIHVGVDGVVKVIDFGIAKAQNLSAGTEPGTLKGKFFYMSPEMIAGRPVDHRADLYAAGVMLYEQLCGRRPFTGSTPDQVLDRIAEARPRRPTEFDPSVPLALEEVCLKALCQNPDERFQTLEEFVRAIEIIGGAAELASSDTLSTYVRRLIPEDTDDVVAAIRHARQVDPSVPETQSTALIPGSARTPRPVTRSKPASSPALAPELPPPPPTIVERSPIPGASAEPKKKNPTHAKRWIALGGAVLAVGAAVAFFTLRPEIPAAERIARAQSIPDRAARAASLGGIQEANGITADQLHRAGELLLEVKAFREALELSDAFVRLHPTDARARLLEAEASIGLRHGKRAEAAIDKARELDPKSPEPAVTLARLKELQGDLPGATAALGEALKKAPNSVRIARRHGYLLSQAGQLDEASGVLLGVLKRQFDPESAAELAFVRYRQDRVPDAHALLRRAIKEQPKMARAHYYLGAVLYRQGDIKAAERAYLEAEQLWGDDSRPLIALCELYAQTGRQDALTELRGRIQKNFAAEAESLLRRCAP